MPQIFKIGKYSIYFWSNEGLPLEPIHVYVSEGRASATATKIWITHNKHCMIANNNSKIPAVVLNRIIRVLEARVNEIIDRWYMTFGEITYFC